MSQSGKPPALAKTLAFAFTLLVIYASLHPFSGWRLSGAPLLDFLTAPWPRYFTYFDLIVNVLAYMPLGFLWMPTAMHRLPAWLSILLVTLASAALSGSMECLQNFLPSRVPSNLDLGCNSLGALLGALAGIRWSNALVSGSRLLRWRHRHLTIEPIGDYGMVLIGLWLLVVISPENLMFGSGDLRQVLDIPPAMPFEAERFSRLESGIAASGTLAVSLLLAAVIRRPTISHVAGLIVAAIALRSFAAALMVAPAQFNHWVTPGNMSGIVLGLMLTWPLLKLAPPLRQMLAALALLACTAMVNLAPANPYLVHAAQLWQQGHFLNFNGLTRLASILWPFMALAFLMARPPAE